MKKIMVMILVIVMVASLLVGCGKDASANGGNNEAPSGNVSTETPEPPKKPEEPAYKPAEDFIITLDNGLEVLKIHDFMLANGFKLDKSEIIGSYGDSKITVENTYKYRDSSIKIEIWTLGESECLFHPESTGRADAIFITAKYKDHDIKWNAGMSRSFGDGAGAIFYAFPGMNDLSTADFSTGEGFYFEAKKSNLLISAVNKILDSDEEICPFEDVGLGVKVEDDMYGGIYGEDVLVYAWDGTTYKEIYYIPILD